ncbi:hypothetical protein CMV_027505 [Castanea mollissima]|uniref:Uncharacterized protein n=1 Tax=Castanea mollissima TaxID=60419 RepID=A0A8J4Q6G6_9ROSI|nr:hypothetical protein CMV_027505 [Castanea mollissima]
MGSHVSAEKVPKVQSSTNELGGDFPRSDGCVDRFVTHAFSAGPQTSEGSGSHGSIKKPFLVSPSTDEIGGVLPRSKGCVDEFVTIGGPLVGLKSSRAEEGCMGSTVFVVDGPAEDVTNFEAIPNSDGQSNSAKPDVSPKLVSPPLSIFKFSDMICNDKLLGQFHRVK